MRFYPSPFASLSRSLSLSLLLSLCLCACASVSFYSSSLFLCFYISPSLSFSLSLREIYASPFVCPNCSLLPHIFLLPPSHSKRRISCPRKPALLFDRDFYSVTQ